MANSCLSAARAALRVCVPCYGKLSADASAGEQLRYAFVFPRPAREQHRRLFADHVAAPLARQMRRGLAATSMASQEEAAATAVEEQPSQEPEAEPVADKEPEPEQGGAAVEAASSDDGGGGKEEKEAEAESGPITKLYFGNLPYNCDSASLAAVVQDYASPEMVEVLYDRTTGRSRGFAFVTMTTVQDCENVIKNLDGTVYGGRTMKVNFADKPKPKMAPLYPETEHKLFVGNLSWTVTGEMLTEVFQRCGNVVGARVLYDGETGRSRGYGFVCYSTKEEMDEALASLDGTEMEGREIRVNMALGKRY